jgi:hypothetical protein
MGAPTARSATRRAGCSFTGRATAKPTCTTGAWSSPPRRGAQAEELLISRDEKALARYLPMLERSVNFIEDEA